MAKIGDTYRMPRGHDKELQKLKKNYNIGTVIGTGAFGIVCNGTMTQENKTVEMAAKIIDLMKVDEKYVNNHLKKEFEALKEYKHDFIVTVFDITFVKITRGSIDRITMYVFMEKALGGDLHDYMADRSKGIPESPAKNLYRMVVSAVDYIHSKKAAHRDIKAENILLMDKKKTIAKLTDFGLSTTCFVPASKTNPEIRLLRDTYCGSPSYFPPEIETQEPYDAMKADVWSMGVLLFFMTHRDFPFSIQQIKQLAKTPRNTALKYKKGLSEECKDLLKKQLEIDPKKRLTMAEVVQHHWLTDKSSNYVE